METQLDLLKFAGRSPSRKSLGAGRASHHLQPKTAATDIHKSLSFRADSGSSWNERGISSKSIGSSSSFQTGRTSSGVSFASAGNRQKSFKNSSTSSIIEESVANRSV